MRRRNLLKGIAASVLQIAFQPRWPLQAGVAPPLTRRVRPTDPQWPRADSWAKLKAVVGGNLLQPQPLFAACQQDANSATCAEVLGNIRNPFYIATSLQELRFRDGWTPDLAPSAYDCRA